MADLYDEILGVPGVADAAVELADAGPVTVRVELEPGADRRSVSSTIRALLERHGLTSQVRERPAGPPVHRPTPSPEAGPPDAGVPPTPGRGPTRPPGGSPPDGSRMPEPEPSTAGSAVRLLDVTAVTVTETAGECTVTVRLSNGRTAGRKAPAHSDAVHRAVLEALWEAAGSPDDPPRLASTDYAGGEVKAVSVVLERPSGARAIGSEFITGTEFAAFARAALVALCRLP